MSSFKSSVLLFILILSSFQNFVLSSKDGIKDNYIETLKAKPKVVGKKHKKTNKPFVPTTNVDSPTKKAVKETDSMKEQTKTIGAPAPSTTLNVSLKNKSTPVKIEPKPLNPSAPKPPATVEGSTTPVTSKNPTENPSKPVLGLKFSPFEGAKSSSLKPTTAPKTVPLTPNSFTSDTAKASQTSATANPISKTENQAKPTSRIQSPFLKQNSQDKTLISTKDKQPVTTFAFKDKNKTETVSNPASEAPGLLTKKFVTAPFNKKDPVLR